MLPNPAIMIIRSPPSPLTMDIKCIKKEMKKTIDAYNINKQVEQLIHSCNPETYPSKDIKRRKPEFCYSSISK